MAGRSARTGWSTLDRLVAGSSVIDGLRAGEELLAAVPVGSDEVLPELVAVVDGSDQVASIAALHAIGAVSGPAASAFLADRLADDRWFVAQHSAWVLSARAPIDTAVGDLVGLVEGGEFGGMLAQRTLAGWARWAGDRIAALLEVRLATTSRAGARRRIVETLGLVGGHTAALTRVALDRGEDVGVRRAALSALGDRPGDPRPLERVRTDGDDELSATAALALADRRLLSAPPEVGFKRGLRIAQVYVHARVDSDEHGAGEHGGIATLLGLLARQIGADPDVARVLSLTKGTIEEAVAGPRRHEEGALAAAVPFGPAEGDDQRASWTWFVEIERGVRRALRQTPADVVHLRLADVGTLAAARVARQLGVPVVFTAAPDPHAVLDDLERTGHLSRRTFGDHEVLDHWWFRARMVERLTDQAAALALLPRRDGRRRLEQYFGRRLDEATSAVIPEGVHAATVSEASAAVSHAPTPRALGDVVADLADRLDALPLERRRLPLLITVGRLHPVKGMGRIVEAWSSDPVLRSSANVVIVGGNLAAPSPDELDVLAVIDEIVGDDRDGLVLLGHRPHHDVARLLAAAAGDVPLVGGGGVYVAGARKEEFGLAIVEALGAGLVVVAPDSGGPATYVDDGDTGILVPSTTPDRLGPAIRQALALVGVAGRAERARTKVLGELTIEAMARRLVALYGRVVMPSAS